MTSTPGGPDWLEAGPRVRRGPVRRGAVAAAVLAFLVVVALLVHQQAGGSPAGALSGPSPTSPASTAGTYEPLGPAPGAGSEPVTVRPAGSPLLPGERGTLYARTDAALYRIELGTGLVASTLLHSVSDDDGDALFAGPHEALLDGGDGAVLVPDGRRAGRAPAIIEQADTTVFPGPADDLWVAGVSGDGNGTRLSRVGLDGRRVPGTSLLLPGSFVASALQAGSGHLLLLSPAGIYEPTALGLHRISTGRLNAMGAHHYLITDCDARYRCSMARYEIASGRRDRVAPASIEDPRTGSVSPDGRWAALTATTAEGVGVEVVDLRTGRTVAALPGQFSEDGQNSSDRQLVWTADGRYLLALLHGQLVVYDVETRRSRAVLPGQPALLKLAYSSR